MTNIVDHYINNLNTIKDIRKKQKYNPDAKLTDKIVKHCLKCKNCWEFDRDSHKSSYFRYVKDFPSYGKKKEPCPNCKEGINK
tara:strand:- start:55 stop:303 length:249 start_codon:yes stop_codon:yes gene_type:complete